MFHQKVENPTTDYVSILLSSLAPNTTEDTGYEIRKTDTWVSVLPLFLDIVNFINFFINKLRIVRVSAP